MWTTSILHFPFCILIQNLYNAIDKSMNCGYNVENHILWINERSYYDST